MGFLDLVERVMAKIPSLPWWFKIDWRGSKILPYLMVLELPLTVAGLALFGIADPDTYRTILWQEGSNHGWNSDPSELLYAYANYRPIQAPAPWNQLYALSSPLSPLVEFAFSFCFAQY